MEKTLPSVTADCTSMGQLNLAFWEGNMSVGGRGNFHKSEH